jgi:predicted RNA binding protein YcfA (HicA-like mRNA interferase family)
MKIPRDLSGEVLVNALCRRWGYVRIHQVGSHIIVQTNMPSHQRLSVPDHRFLRIGTLNAILRTVADHKGVLKEAILDSI